MSRRDCIVCGKTTRNKFSCSIKCRDEYIAMKNRKDVDLKRECRVCKKDFDLWVEVKGTIRFDRFNKTGKFIEMYPELNYIVADSIVLSEGFELDLSNKRLGEIVSESLGG